jgi:oxygen-independent coproporphyrinogen-3 oxidase
MEAVSRELPRPYRVWVPTVRPPILNMFMCKPLRDPSSFVSQRASALGNLGRLGAPGVRHDMYVHIPVCFGKCTFCAVETKEIREVVQLVPRYVAALHRELDMYAAYPAVRNSEFGVVYIGGGTPSILSAEHLHKLVSRLVTEFSCRGATVTVEGNSTSFTQEKLAAIREAGATRVSIGVQSFDKRLSGMLETPHDPEEIGRWVEMARSTGFEHLNLDLIAGLPGDDLASLERDIEAGLSLRPTSLSVYDLMLVPHTPLARAVRGGNVGSMPDARGYVERLSLTRSKLEGLGWANVYGNTYSAVRDGVELPAGPPSGNGACLAVGSSSYGMLADHHYVNNGSMIKYMEAVERGEFPVFGGRIAATPWQKAEHALIDLCFHLAMDREAFRGKVGVDVVDLAGRRLARLERKGLLEIDERQVRLTDLGKVWSGRVCGTLLGPGHLLRLLSMKVMSELFGRMPERVRQRMKERAGRG